MDPLVFETIEIQKVPVKIAGKDYELRELNGKQRDAYLTKNNARMRFIKGKPAGLTSFDGVQTDLLVECLFDVETNKAVPVAVIQTWPASIQDALFEAARKLSKLGKEAEAKDPDEDDDTKAKNE